MLNHYFTLIALIDEFRRSLRGCRIEQVYSQQRNVLTILLSPSTGEEVTLLIGIDPKLNYIYTRQRYMRAKKNSVDLFRSLPGSSVEDIDIVPYERILRIQCSRGQRLSLHLFQTAASNIYLSDNADSVLEAFKHSGAVRGSVYPGGGTRFDERILNDLEVFSAEISGCRDRSLSAALRHLLPFIGKVYSEELCVRAGVEGSSDPRTLTPGAMRDLFAATTGLMHEAQSPHPVLYDSGTGVFLSVSPLQSQPEWGSERFSSVNDAVAAAVSSWHRRESRDEQEGALFASLTNERSRVARARAAAEAQAAAGDRAAEYERFGNLIVAHLSSISKGMKRAELTDLLGDGKTVSVPLEPHLTPAKNAERYFQKAKDARGAAEESVRRATELRRREHVIARLCAGLEGISSEDGFKEFLRLHEEDLKELNLLPAVRGKEQLPFRMFTVAGGLEVWVGKSSANNDLLTTRYASPHDLWFHVRGAGGSHTVLKVKGREAPPREAIRAAAAIAAYYSKMRNAKTVPVAYCERKYVRKPKGAAPGSVLLEREEILFVNPALP